VRNRIAGYCDRISASDKIHSHLIGECHYGGVMLIGPVSIVFGFTAEPVIVSMIVAARLKVLAFLLIRRR
jgi:uncharacterized protein (TIGR00304 family)